MTARTTVSSGGGDFDPDDLDEADLDEAGHYGAGPSESDLARSGVDEADPDESADAAPVARRTTGPGVVVVHDWYGPLPHVAEFADELTMAGFDVELVDLYDGVTTLDPGRAEVLAESLDGADALEQIADAVERLRAGGAPYVGAVGFSLGGSLVLRVAGAGALDAVVAYYATCDPAAVAGLTCPVQLHLAQEFVAVLRTGGAPVDTFVYPGTEHSFANADVELADPRAADVALARTVGFLTVRLAG
jgi:carboxymethylenebutenolidase